MMKLCTMGGATVFGIGGGFLADAFGMDTFSFGSIVISGVASIIGVYAGWKLAQRLDE